MCILSERTSNPRGGQFSLIIFGTLCEVIKIGCQSWPYDTRMASQPASTVSRDGVIRNSSLSAIGRHRALITWEKFCLLMAWCNYKSSGCTEVRNAEQQPSTITWAALAPLWALLVPTPPSEKWKLTNQAHADVVISGAPRNERKLDQK